MITAFQNTSSFSFFDFFNKILTVNSPEYIRILNNLKKLTKLMFQLDRGHVSKRIPIFNLQYGNYIHNVSRESALSALLSILFYMGE